MSIPTATGPISHFIFVDFENVPSVDLELTTGKLVHVTLLIGEKQRRLELPLVRQIHRLASQVTLVEVGASGRNALDLVLACHLGKAVAQQPDSRFYIVSGDKDFDPLIAHLSAEKHHASRHNSFAEVPCLEARKAIVHRTPTLKPTDRLEKLVARLMNPDRSRPKRKKSLLAHINATYGNKLSETEQQSCLDELIKRGVLSVDPQGKVSY